MSLLLLLLFIFISIYFFTLPKQKHLFMGRTSAVSLLLGGLAVLAAARRCQNLTVEVDISARNGVFNIETPATDIDVTNFIFEMGTQGRNYTDEILTGVSHSWLLEMEVVIVTALVERWKELTWFATTVVRNCGGHIRACGDVLRAKQQDLGRVANLVPRRWFR